MADVSQAPSSSPPAAVPVVPAKRPLEHQPPQPSPLNPDQQARPRAREERRKVPTAKVRGESTQSETPTSVKKGKKSDNASTKKIMRPIRYKLNEIKPGFFEAPKALILNPVIQHKGVQFYETSEHLANKRNFRYSRTICDPLFKSSQYHRLSEVEPYKARISNEDASPHILVDKEMLSVTSEKGFRMCRANVGAREGRWYYEIKILSGVKTTEQAQKDISNVDTGGHVRFGWARKEASLDGPVGFDAYSYGLRDISGQKVHMSRPKDFAVNSEFCEGDVIGLEICLPSLPLHRKVVEGVYNKAVDVADDLDPAASIEAPDIIRDRIPVPYKAHYYFEQFEYSPTKELEELANPLPAPVTATATETDPPNPNHPQTPLRTLPFSSIKVYKNGDLIGTPFTDLLAFLPPASKPPTIAGARDGFDDGSLGYYPAISLFRRGAAQANFGPDFWFPPPELAKSEDVEMTNTTEVNVDPATTKHIAGTNSRVRPISERFNEQIAEDIMYDLIDEVDFWALDVAEGAMTGLNVIGDAVLGPVDPEAAEVGVGVDLANGAGEIREMVQQES